MRKLPLLLTICGLVAPAALAAPPRTVTVAVMYAFSGQYTNTQKLDGASCSVWVTETADYHGWQRFKPLQLPLGEGSGGRSKERLRLLTGKWTMRGSVHAHNDCVAPAEQFDCTGAVRFNAHGPRRGVLSARVRRGTVFFSLDTGYSDIFESDTYALDPTIGSSTPDECLDPLSPYLGLRDVTASLMRVVATVPVSRLANLRRGAKLVLGVRPASALANAVRADCNGRDRCRARKQHAERLTIVVA